MAVWKYVGDAGFTFPANPFTRGDTWRYHVKIVGNANFCISDTICLHAYRWRHEAAGSLFDQKLGLELKLGGVWMNRSALPQSLRAVSAICVNSIPPCRWDKDSNFGARARS